MSDWKKLLGFFFVAAVSLVGCTGSQGPNESCNNAGDDDGDGLVDCADPDCDGQQGPDDIDCEARCEALAPGADLSACRYLERDFSGIDLSGADLSDAILGSSNLSGANLSDANLTSSQFIFTDLSGADLSNVNGLQADLAFTNLSNAILVNANFLNASFFNANMTDANVSGTDFTAANLSGVCGAPIDSSSATYGNTLCPDDTNSNDAINNSECRFFEICQ